MPVYKRFFSLPRLFMMLSQVFFILMLVVPTSLQEYRGGLLLFIVIGMLLYIIAGKPWELNFSIFFISLSNIFFGVFFVFYGLIHDAPGALSVSSVYVIWPIFFMFVIGFLYNLSVVCKLAEAVLVGISIATIMCLMVAFGVLFGYGDLISRLFEFQGIALGIFEGHFEYRLYNLATLAYGFPYVFALLCVQPKERLRKRFFLFGLLILMAIAILSSGRRALYLVILLTPFVVLFSLQLSSLRMSTLSLVKFIALALLLSFVVLSVGTLFFDYSSLLESFVSSFSDHDESTSERYRQGYELLESFSDSPLLGNGLGSTVSVIRDPAAPWSYEMSYLALLMNVGLLGFLFYTLSIAWIYWAGFKISVLNKRFSRLFVPLASGLFIFLVVNSTNPYLGKFDYLWVIFLPVALINAYRVGGSRFD